MAVKILSDIDVQILKQKALLDQLSISIKSYSATHQTLPHKVKAGFLKDIQLGLESQKRFLDKTGALSLQNTGARFAFENLKQRFFIVQSTWRKFENSLNQAS